MLNARICHHANEFFDKCIVIIIIITIIVRSRLHRSRRSLVNHAAPFFAVAVVTHKYLYFIVNECRLYLYAAHNTRRTIIYLGGMSIELDTRAIVPYEICFIIMIIGKLYARLDTHTQSNGATTLSSTGNE